MYEIRIVTYKNDPGSYSNTGFYAPMPWVEEFTTSDEAIAWVKNEQRRTGKCYAVIGDGFRWETSSYYAGLNLPLGDLDD